MNNSDKLVYLDNAATTQMPQEVLDSLSFHLEHNFGNANTKYKQGAFAKDFLEASRQTIAECIGAHPQEIYFTSGATESNNWIFSCIANEFSDGSSAHIITSPIEHESVLEPLKRLARNNAIGLEFLEVNEEAQVSEVSLSKLIEKNTSLVSVMYANNEVGTIQDIKTLSEIAHEGGALFHSDAVQALGHVALDVRELGLDYLSASAHKFHGPKGVGFLYVKEGSPISPLLYGGGQEYQMRSGTQNVPYIVAMAEALQWSISLIDKLAPQFKQWQDYLIDMLCQNIDGIRLTGSRTVRLDHLCSFVIDGVDTETLLMLLDQDGICVSAGSACSSGELEISHVLKAIGLDSSVSRGALRVSYSYLNNFHEIEYAAQKIIAAVKGCRNFTGSF